jgi:Uma2 family endonuclease
MHTAPSDSLFIPGGEPAWEIATLFPSQGAWSVDDYLEFTDETKRLVELVDGKIEVLPMPTVAHQRILSHLFMLIYQFVRQHDLGEVLFAGVRVQLDATTFREPDIVFLAKGHDANMDNRYWSGADWSLEVVSDDEASRQRDLVTKRTEYAAASIPEYWIVDPREHRITVLTLDGEAYAVHGEYVPGQQAASPTLKGFAVDVAAVFAAAKG